MFNSMKWYKFSGGFFSAIVVTSFFLSPALAHLKVSITDKTEELVTANNRFSFKLLTQLAQEDVNENIFISPLSIAMAMTMTFNGAAGQTRADMAFALELGDLKRPELNQAYTELGKVLKGLNSQVELTIANSLWARRGINFQQDFLERNQKFFGAQISTVDFNAAGALNDINEWVDNVTNGKITKIIDRFDPLTAMFLANAIYFKGEWSEKFDESKTKDGLFHLIDGRKKVVPMMNQQGRFPYFKGDDFQAVSLSYGDGDVGMYIFLPEEGASLTDFIVSITEEKWDTWISKFRRWPGKISLVRFSLNYEKKLNDALQTLGMGNAFDPIRADFSDLYSGDMPNVYLSNVMHKAVVEVNEEGTEAAAATGVTFAYSNYQEPFNFVVDRPFFFAIRDNQTGTLLFMGMVTEPE